MNYAGKGNKSFDQRSLYSYYMDTPGNKPVMKLSQLARLIDGLVMLFVRLLLLLVLVFVFLILFLLLILILTARK